MKPFAGIVLLILVFYADVAFFSRTFSNASVEPGVTATGPYGNFALVGATGRDPGASIWHDESWAPLLERIWREGSLPLWNPYQGIGTPLLANGQSSALSPLRMLYIFAPNERWEDYYLLLRILIAASGVLLLAQSLGMGSLGSFAAAAATALSGHLSIHAHVPMLESDIWFPWILYGVEILSRNRRKGLAIVAIAAFMDAAGGYLESTLFHFIAAFLWSLLRQRSLRHSIDVGFGLCAGTGLAAPTVFAVAEFLSRGATSHSGMEGLAIFYPSAAISLFAPTQVFIPIFSVAPYVGTVVSIIAVIGLFSKSPDRWLRGAIGGLILLIVLKIFGTPGIHQAIAAIPLINQGFFAKHSFFILVVLVSISFGLGVEAIRNRTCPRVRTIAWLSTAAVAVLLWICRKYFLEPLAIATDHIFLEILRYGLAAMLIAAAAGLAANHGRQTGAVLVVFFFLVESGLFLHRERPTRIPKWQRPPWAESIPEGERMIALSPGDLHPNTASALGIRDFQMIDAIVDRRFATAVDQMIKPGFLKNPYSIHGHQTYPAAQTLGFFGVGYAVTRDSDLPEPWMAVADHAPWKVWKNPLAEPQVALLSPGSLRTIESRTDHRSWEITSAQANTLRIREGFDAGWKGIIDGKPAAIAPLESIFMSMTIPAGTHRVEIIYRPWTVTAGFGISLLSAIVLLVVCIPRGKFRGTRQTPS